MTKLKSIMDSIKEKCLVLDYLKETIDTYQYVEKNFGDGNLKNYYMMRWFIENFLKDKSGNFLIIGFAPGITCYMCALEFPNVIFHIFDPETYLKNLDQLNNVIVHNYEFTKEIIDFYSIMKNLIVYSDLRTASGSIHLDEDTKLQQDLLIQINANYSMLKYKISECNTIMPHGEKIIQPFSKHTNEVRIIQSKNNYIYSATDPNYALYLKNKLNYFNNLRKQNLVHDIKIIQRMFNMQYVHAKKSFEIHECGIQYFYFIFREYRYISYSQNKISMKRKRDDSQVDKYNYSKKI